MTRRHSIPPPRPALQRPLGPDPLLIRAHRLLQSGRLEDAERDLRKLVKRDPDSPDALYLLGLTLTRRGATAEAERVFGRCIECAPRHAMARLNLAGLLMSRGQLAAAESGYAQAVRLVPREPVAFYNWGCSLRALGRLTEAIAAYRQALALKPDFVEPAVNLASALTEQGDLDQAEGLYRGLLARYPALVDLRESLGLVYHTQRRLAEARDCFDTLLQARPGHPGALLGLALVALERQDLPTARRLIDAARSSGAADKLDLLITTAYLRWREGDQRGAIATLTEAVRGGANRPQHYLTLAEWYARLKERDQAVAILEQSLAQFGERPPDLLPALVVHQYAICDWRGAAERLERVLTQIRGPMPPPIAPFAALTLPGLSPMDLLRVTRRYVQDLAVAGSRLPHPGPPRDPRVERLRIGYLSYDLHEHATAYLTAAVFESHDRDRFEVFAYSYGPDDQSPTRQRLVAAFEHFVDVAELSHEAAARRIHDDGIDILVDLKGYTSGARPEIVALRPAPVQVNWLGYPGTMAAPFMDYMIVDETVVPQSEAAAYTESLAYLPDTYAPIDPRRPVAPTPRRAEVGLPEAGFVFCCFNNVRKINPEVFAVWCRLLMAVPDSVLWLFAGQAAAARLRDEAARLGADPGRLIFAPKVPQPEHLARLPLADLVIDTRPYNAHTTASDALWMGVPMLTCPGETFPSRVAASLLRALGLPELIAPTLDDYESIAVHLARHPDALLALRERLGAARERAPYFDPGAFTRHLETLYRRMWERHAGGLPPALLPPERTS